MKAYTDKVELEKEKTLKGFAINGIKALPEIGSSELLYKIINLIREEKTNTEKPAREEIPSRSTWSKIWV